MHLPLPFSTHAHTYPFHLHLYSPICLLGWSATLLEKLWSIFRPVKCDLILSTNYPICSFVTASIYLVKPSMSKPGVSCYYHLPFLDCYGINCQCYHTWLFDPELSTTYPIYPHLPYPSFSHHSFVLCLSMPWQGGCSSSRSLGARILEGEIISWHSHIRWPVMWHHVTHQVTRSGDWSGDCHVTSYD